MASLWNTYLQVAGKHPSVFHGQKGAVALDELATSSYLGRDLESLRGRSVLIATREQLYAAIAVVELDGVARRIVLCTSDLGQEQLKEVAKLAGADAIVSDSPGAASRIGVAHHCVLESRPMPAAINRNGVAGTEWILLTSGTTASPKLVVHTLQSLGATLPRQSAPSSVWGTFYDIRRYGGLQIFLRAVLAGSSLVLMGSDEPIGTFLTRAGALGITHISGTPSHWRRVLMSGQAALLKPRYVRLSGEIADQTVLDQLRGVYPDSTIAHAFASTEAGVAFDVDDGHEGFPVEYVDRERNGIAMTVVDGTLRIRSQRNALRYLGANAPPLTAADGYVDTGDLVELVDGRYYFRGRKGGIINVGGQKVYPEEVEAVLNANSRVRMSLVHGRRNPITGALVVADIVVKDAVGTHFDAAAAEALKSDLLAACRRALPAHKVPATLRFVPTLEVTAAGKLMRPHE